MYVNPFWFGCLTGILFTIAVFILLGALSGRDEECVKFVGILFAPVGARMHPSLLYIASAGSVEKKSTTGMSIITSMVTIIAKLV